MCGAQKNRQRFLSAFFTLVFCVVCALPAAGARTVSIPVVYQERIIGHARMTTDYRFNTGDLQQWVDETMCDESAAAFKAIAAADGHAALAAAAASGLTLQYNEEYGVITATPDPARQREKSIALRSPYMGGAEHLVTPAKLSGFVNVFAGMDYLHESPAGTGRGDARVDMDGAVNMQGWVLESRATYTENADTPFRRGETRLLHDNPDTMVRFAAGDLSYPVAGFQSYHPMLGVSLARNFSLQPYRVTSPTGQTSFVLHTESTVDIMVNGVAVRTLRLAPGVYNVSDFPVADGSNDVTLRITDAAGRIEERSFPLITDQNLLTAGLHEYAYNIGILSEHRTRGITYLRRHPALSLFHRYGFTDVMTAGFSLQGDPDVQQAGIMGVYAFSFGTFALQLAGSHLDRTGMDGAGEISFRHHSMKTGRDVTVLFRTRGTDFAELGDRSDDDKTTRNITASEIAFRYNQVVSGLYTAGVGARFRNNRGTNGDDWSYSAGITRRFSPSLNLSLTAEHRRNDGTGVFLGLTWSPQGSRHSMTASADTLARTQNTHWHYRAAHDVRSFNAGAGITRSGNNGNLHATGNIGYTGYRGQVALRHDYVTADNSRDNQSRSQITAGAALAFAGDRIALSRPIQNSFVILAPHDNLSGRPIGINPTDTRTQADNHYQAEINRFGPAVLPDMTPYMYRPVRIDTHNLPEGYDIGREQFAVLPSYKSGAVFRVGNSANIFADGYIQWPDGRPVTLEAGIIHPVDSAEDAPAPQEFFTNQEGRFRISRLSPGRYRLYLHRHPDHRLDIDIPAQKPGRFAAGTIVMQEIIE